MILHKEYTSNIDSNKIDNNIFILRELRKAFDSMSSFLGDSVGDLSEKQDEGLYFRFKIFYSCCCLIGDIILNIR